MILKTIGRIRAHEVLEAGIFIEVRATMRLQIGLVNPKILNFKIFMALKVLEIIYVRVPMPQEQTSIGRIEGFYHLAACLGIKQFVVARSPRFPPKHNFRHLLVRFWSNPIIVSQRFCKLQRQCHSQTD